MDEPEKGQERDKQFRSGDNSGGETPLPIPNREVKPTRADGTVPFRDGRVGRHQAFFIISPIPPSVNLYISIEKLLSLY